MAEHTAVNVVIDDEHRQSRDTVVDALRAAGLHVTATLDTVGIVMGWVDAERLDGLRGVTGVVAVEANRQLRALR